MKKTGKHIHELQRMMQRVISGKASADEVEFLDKYYASFDHKDDDPISESEWEEINTIISNRLKKTADTVPVIRRQFFTVPRVAAAIAFLLLCSVVYLQFQPSEVALTNVAKTQKPVIAPGGNKATLTLADGTTVYLGDSSVTLPSQAGIKIARMPGGQLVYSHETSALPDAVNQFNVLATPKGGIFQINLPDGTKVWLNSASSLKYPLVFKENERRVELEGEAYFEVAHNRKKPFYVISSTQTIEVLGTHFNVSSYSEDKITKTTLLEGSVRIKATRSGSVALLKPGQQATNHPDFQQLFIKKADIEHAMAWKAGLFRFDNEDIHSIMAKLSRWYDVDVVLKGVIQNMRFGGSVSRFTDIEKVLRKLELTNTIHFKIEGRRVIVMK